WPRIKRRPRRNSRRSTRPTNFCPTRTNARNPTSWARTGNPARSSGPRPATVALAAARVFAADAPPAARSFISAAPVSAISSSKCSARGCAARAAAGLGGGGFGRRGNVTEEDFAERGADIEGDIMVTLEEAARGSVRTVNVRHGDRNESHQVKIPSGISEGQKLRLAGRGESGSGGGENGDLYLRVRFAKHPDFEVDGHNLIYELELAPWEAALGAEISVPTLDAKVNIKIPAGAPSGQKLRVRHRGLVQRDGTRGDLMVITKIVVPEKLSAAEKKLWEQLAHESKFNPRS